MGRQDSLASMTMSRRDSITSKDLQLSGKKTTALRDYETHVVPSRRGLVESCNVLGVVTLEWIDGLSGEWGVEAKLSWSDTSWCGSESEYPPFVDGIRYRWMSSVRSGVNRMWVYRKYLIKCPRHIGLHLAHWMSCYVHACVCACDCVCAYVYAQVGVRVCGGVRIYASMVSGCMREVYDGWMYVHIAHAAMHMRARAPLHSIVADITLRARAARKRVPTVLSALH